MTPEEQKLAACLAQAATSLERWVCEHPGFSENVLFTVLPYLLMLAVAMAFTSFMRRNRPFAPTMPMFLSDLTISSALLGAILIAIAVLRGLLGLQRVTTP